MQRRSILKQIGAVAGAGALVDTNVRVVSGEPKEKPTKTKGVFSEFRFEISDSDTELPLVSSCLLYPQQSWEKNRNKLFLNNVAERHVDPASNDKLVSTHAGVKSGEQTEISFGAVPDSASISGNHTLVAGSSPRTLAIEQMDKHSLRVTFDGNELELEKDDSTTTEYGTEVEYGPGGNETTEANVTVYASHYGKVNIVASQRNFVYPKTKRMKRALKEERNEQKRHREDDDVLTIVEHEKTIELVPAWRDQ